MAVIVALAIVPLVMAAAFAVDLGNVAQLHRRAMTAVDDAALSGADMLGQNASPAATFAAVKSYLEQNYASVTDSQFNSCTDSSPPSQDYSALSGEDCVYFNSANTAISVNLPPQTATFGLARAANARPGGQLLNTKITAQATAKVTGGQSPCGLCLLNKSGRDVDVEGSSYINVTGGAITVNSSNTSQSNPQYGTYVSSWPSSSQYPYHPISASSINVPSTSSYYGAAPYTFSSTPTVSTPISDPLSFLPAPTPGNSGSIPSGSFTSNTSGNITVSPGQYGSVSSGSCTGCEVTIPPGNYDNLSAVGSGTLVLEPGIYFITGSMTVNGAAVLDEQPGVLLYFTCATSSSYTQVQSCARGNTYQGSLNLNASGVINWNPMTTGTYAKLSVFYDRNDTSQIVSDGSTELAFSGTLYAPAAQLSVSGSGAALSSLIIVGSVVATGNTPVEVTYNPAQNVQPPGGSFLCSVPANTC